MLVVLKLGGSLLAQTDWHIRLNDFIENRPPTAYLMIVGGGKAVEAMRELDAIHRLDRVNMHWRCVELMELNQQIAIEILARNSRCFDLRQISTSEEFSILKRAGKRDKNLSIGRSVSLVSVNSFYSSILHKSNAIAAKHSRVPALGWQTTSDAIAVYLAQIVDADECILLKSCEILEPLDLRTAAQSSLIDAESLRLSEFGPPVRLFQL